MSVPVPQKLSVLFVDDQPFLLKSIQRVIHKKAPNWVTRIALSGSEALAMLEESPSDIVVSDMNMPGMNGASLLEIVKKKHPNALRFILSGYASPENTLSSIGIAHQFFNKPVDTNEVVAALELSQSLYRKISDSKLQSIIAKVGTLPTPKRVFCELTNLIADPSVQLEEIAKIISEDASISAKILQMVNSAFFGRSIPVESIQEAVAVLGVNNVKSLIMVVGLNTDYADKLNAILSVDGYSRHSLEVATLCRWLGKRSGLNSKDQESLFTAGLLHNIGKLVILSNYPDYYEEEQLREDPYEPLLLIEKEGEVPVGHAIMGAALLALWGLPAKIVDAVAFHHDPAISTNALGNYATIVHLADAITNYRHHSDASVSIWDTHFINAEYFEELGLCENLNDRIAEYLEYTSHAFQ